MIYGAYPDLPDVIKAVNEFLETNLSESRNSTLS